MRNILLLTIVLRCAVAQSQTLTDSGALRSYINTFIVSNSARAITASNFNIILNGFINITPNDSISIAQGSSNDTLFFWKRRAKAFYVLLRIGSGTAIGQYASLTDVTLTTLSDGQLVKWNSGTSKWNNFTLDKSFIGLGAVENTALSTWGGSGNITHLGTVATAIWNGSPIADTYISSASNWNAKQNAITTGTALQYFKGDLTLGTLNSAAVGLGNVQNVDQTNASNLASGSVPSARIGNGTVSIAAINASGGASTDYLRKDGTWSTPATGVTAYASLTDVALTSIANNQLVKWNSGTSKWNNFLPGTSDVTGWLGYTPMNPTGTSAQYWRGNGTLATFPTDLSSFTNGPAYLSGTVGVATGGTGNTTFTAYGLLAAGTTSTGALQQVSGTGTSGQVLVSNGAGTLPTWQTGPTSSAYSSLSDVALTSIANNQLVKWNSGTSKWNNFLPGTSDVTGWLGYTPMNPTGTAAQYWKGNGTLGTFPTSVSFFINDASYVAGTGTISQYIRGNGTLATTDSSMIPNFYLKVRSLLSASSYIQYNSTTGVFTADTSVNKLATQTMLGTYAKLNDTRFAPTLSATAAPSNVALAINTGTGTAIPAATTSNAGVMLPAHFNQLDSLHKFSDSIRIYQPPGTDSLYLCVTLASTGVEMCKFQTTLTTFTGANQLSGDVLAGPGSGNLTATLATVNSNVGSFGDAMHIPTVTVNSKGLITGVGLATITAGITNLGNTPAAGSVQINSSSGTPTTVPGGTTSLAGVITANQVQTITKRLKIVNRRSTGADSLAFSVHFTDPTIPDSLIFRDVQFIGSGLFVDDLSTPDVIVKKLTPDTTAGLQKLATQGFVARGFIPNTGPVSPALGGTGLSSYAVGDLPYASTSTVISKLADVATGSALISGGVGTAPSYGKIGLTTHVSGTLGVGNGGSGASTLSGYLFGNGASAYTASTTIPGAAITGNITGNAANITGQLAASSLGSGTGASSTTVLHGDMTWSSIPAGGTLTNFSAGDLSPLFTTTEATTTTTPALTFALSNAAPHTFFGNFTTVSGSPSFSVPKMTADFSNEGTTATLLHGNASGTFSFSPVALASDVSGNLPPTNGGTGITSYSLGQLLYSSGSNTLATLNGNTSATKQFLIQTGTGSVSAAPTWGVISESDVASLVSDLAAKASLSSPAFTGTATAPTAAGGTATTQLANTLFVQNAIAGVSNAFNGWQSISSGTSGTINKSNVAFTFSTGISSYSLATPASPVDGMTFDIDCNIFNGNQIGSLTLTTSQGFIGLSPFVTTNNAATTQAVAFPIGSHIHGQYFAGGTQGPVWFVKFN